MTTISLRMKEMKIDLTKEEWNKVSAGLLTLAYTIIKEPEHRNPMETLGKFDELRNLSTKIRGQILTAVENGEE